MSCARGVLRLTAMWLAGSLAACGGCGGGKGREPPPAPTNLALAWASFDQLLVTWTPPGVPVDGFAVEGRIGTGAFESIAANVPPDAVGGVLTLDAAVAELVTVGIRMRSIRAGVPSDYTPEATILRGLRAPAALAVRAQVEDVALSWTQRSSAAQQVIVERAVWDFILAQLGPYQTVATLPASTTSWTDTTTAAPGVAYGYRISNAATHQGASVHSDAVAQMADATTTLSPPAGLAAELAADGVRLTWTPTSRNGTGQVVERSDATADSFGTIARLDPAATSYVDPTPAAGAYRYRVSVVIAPTFFGQTSGDAVTVYIAPPAGSWGLAQDVLHVPCADGIARDASGAWWFARHWTNGTPVPTDSGAFTPSASGWDVHRFGTGAGFLAQPGLLLDPAGRPHVLWLKNVDPVPTTAPRQQLWHSWSDGGIWSDELVAERVFSSDNLGYEVQFGIDGAGTLHAVWEASELSGFTMLILREHATNAGGSWSVSSLPLDRLDQRNALSFHLGVAPDGTAHLVALGTLLATTQPALVHLRRLRDGTWQDEIVPTDALSFFEQMRIVARGVDDVDLLYTRQSNGFLPPVYEFQARTAAGWGAAAALGDGYLGSGHLLPSLAVSPDGSRRAALLELADGLALATWEAATGWQTGRIHPIVPFDVPWLGFDSGGALDVLVPGTAVGADGYTDRIHLRSTR